MTKLDESEIFEPVAEPTPTKPATALSDPTAPTDTSATPDTPVTATPMPPGYLSAGYYATTDKGTKYLCPEFVSSHAQSIAATLAAMRLSDFSTLMRGLKSAKKRTLPFEARQTAAAELLPKSLALVHRQKAPVFLSSFIQANLDAIHNDDDWNAFYRHCEAIAGFLVQERG